ncbi:MAG: ATP-binding protein [Thermodesulfobacteriota bacterium]
MKRPLTITTKLTVVFVLFAAALLVGVGLLAYTSGRSALLATVSSNLSSIAIEKQAAIDTWTEEAKAHIAVIAASRHLQDYITTLLTATDPAKTRAIADRLLTDLRLWTGLNKHFRSFMLIEPESGRIIASTDPGNEGKFVEDRLYFISGRKSPYVQNPYYDIATQTPVMTGSTPVISADRRLLAVLAGHLNIDELDQIVARRTGLAVTDEAFLVNTSHLFVTQPRFVADSAILKRGIYSEAVKRGLAGNSGVLSADDYRGIPAITVYRWLPKRELCLIVKIDEAEALAPSRRFGWTILLFGGFLLLLASVIAFGLARTISRPLLALKEGAARFGRGERNLHLPVSSEDEIGQLTREFNTMAASLAEKEYTLRVHAEQLEQMVVSRTAELTRSEALLRESEQKFRSLIEDAPDAIYVHADYRYVYLNPAAVKLFGAASADQLIGSAILERYDPGLHEQIRERMRLLYEERRKSLASERFYHRLDGTTVPVEIRAVPIRYDGRNAALTFVRDITERRRAEQELKRAVTDLERSNRDLEQFAYVASHDLQEPLRMVSSYTELLARHYEGRLDEKARKFIDYARDGAVRMQALINDLLMYSRIGTRGRPPEAVDTHALLGEAHRNLAAQIEENRAIITNDGLPTVRADASQLVQVFQNLISNAIKYQGEGAPHIHVAAREDGQEWVFSVRDNGIGIEKQYAERVFVIFQRLHTRQEYPGTGIGLALCKRIVERHGGRIWFASEPGSGTTFFFTIPKYT